MGMQAATQLLDAHIKDGFLFLQQLM